MKINKEGQDQEMEGGDFDGIQQRESSSPGPRHSNANFASGSFPQREAGAAEGSGEKTKRNCMVTVGVCACALLLIIVIALLTKKVASDCKEYAFMDVKGNCHKVHCPIFQRLNGI